MKCKYMPGHPRSQPRPLVETFGYSYFYRGVGQVEIALLEVLGEIGMIPKDVIELLTPDVKERILAIDAIDVDEAERITKHDILAWKAEVAKFLPEPLMRFLHIALTSWDSIATSYALMFRMGHSTAVKPLTLRVIHELAGLVKKYASTLQVGRTHGQWAVTITVGFWLATILSRLIDCYERCNENAMHIVGGISGATGTHNAEVALGIAEKCGKISFEDRILSKVGLRAAPISTQILPPEPIHHYLFSVLSASAVLGQLACDCRQLMRPEIGEVIEPFEATQGGSSTMAHKRNPVTWEGIQGDWENNRVAFGYVLATMISEHQRDLVGSRIHRRLPEIVINYVNQLTALLRKGDKSDASFLARLNIDSVTCLRNLREAGQVIMAEPVYIALQMAGMTDAHKILNHQVMPMAMKNRNIPLLVHVGALAENNPALSSALGKIPPELKVALGQPEQYTGIATSLAHQTAARALQLT